MRLRHAVHRTSKVAALFAAIWAYTAAPAVAHDFWLQPGAYWMAPQAVTPMTLQVGHGPSRQRSPIPLRRVTRFVSVGASGAPADLRGRLRPGGAENDGDLQFRTPGTYVLVLQTDDQAQTHLPALRFNDYLQAEGLTPAIEERARRRREDTDGSENYSRCAKAIVQVGPMTAASQAQVTRPVGLSLEIVPEVSPYAVPRPTTLPVHVIYQGRPLAGALVMLTRLENDASPFETHRTDASGRAVFMMPTTGTWLLNVLWTRPQPPSAETDFETTFSSLSFGFPSS